MQITETVSEGLRRVYRVVVDAKYLDDQLTGRIEEMKPRVHLKGFRPGKAPTSFLKKTYGKELMNEVVNKAATEGKDKAIADNALKPAFPPRVELASELEQVVEGKADLEFTVTVDLMPEFELVDPAKLKIEKLVADVTDEEVENAVANLAEQARTYSPREAGEAAENGDAVLMDFVGSIDGEEFPGGKADNFNLVLGSGQLIPGFEAQLVGAKAGDARDVNVTFPAAYQEPKLAGKDAHFAVTVKDVRKPDPIVIDDELAKRVGLTALGELKERMREQMKNDFNRASRLHMKRRILDALDTAHGFDLPPTMVEGEFNAIWRAVEAELQREGKTAEDEGKSEEELKKEYHDIAERRVRLGLVLARIGEQNGIQVTPDEIQRAVAMRARQFPGQEQQVYDYYAQSAQAMAEIRAPIFEDKVVDFIGELAEISERKVDRETLFLDPDEAAARLDAE